MFILTVTVHNSNDPTCQRLSLTKRFEIDLDDDNASFVRECIKYTEKMHRDIFPRGMTYNIPYTEVDVNHVADNADRLLLRAAYASGQLRGTILEDQVRIHFKGASPADMDTAPETPSLSESLGRGSN